MRLAFLTRVQRPFNGETVHKEPLGGTQSSMIYLGQELAALGHDVHIFCHCGSLAGRFKGVTYHPVQALIHQSRQPWDVFVSVADEAALKLGIKAHKTIWWSHNDYAYLRQDNSGLRQEIGHLLQTRADKIFAVSDWQSQELATLFDLPLAHFYTTRNGVHWPYFEAQEDFATPNVLNTSNHNSDQILRLLYTSVPDRGLDVLLEIFPKIQTRFKQAFQAQNANPRQTCPELALHLYSSFKVWGENTDADEALAQVLETRAKQLDNVFFHEPLTHVQLAQALQQGTLWVYPNHAAPGSGFEAETSCIAALEAQAAGLPVLSSSRGALPETVRDGQTGFLFPGDSQQPDYQELFIQTAVRLLLDRQARQKLSQAARQHIYETHRWSEIAQQWSDYLADFVSTRQKNKIEYLPDQRPDLSVILPVCGRPDLLQLCLAQLTQQDLNNFEVIILDNHPTESVKTLLSEYTDKLKIRYQYRPSSLFNVAQARNQGAELSRGSVLVFLDADIWVPKTFLTTHLELQKIKTGHLFSNYIYQQKPQTPLAKTDEWMVDLRAQDVPFQSPQAPVFPPVTAQYFRAAAFSMRRSDLKRSTGFDPDFSGWGYEDLDFALRQIRAGFKLCLLDERCLHLYHEPAATDQETERENNWLKLTRRHGLQDYVKMWRLPPRCT